MKRSRPLCLTLLILVEQDESFLDKPLLRFYPVVILRNRHVATADVSVLLYDKCHRCTSRLLTAFDVALGRLVHDTELVFSLPQSRKEG